MLSNNTSSNIMFTFLSERDIEYKYNDDNEIILIIDDYYRLIIKIISDTRINVRSLIMYLPADAEYRSRLISDILKHGYNSFLSSAAIVFLEDEIDAIYLAMDILDSSCSEDISASIESFIEQLSGFKLVINRS